MIIKGRRDRTVPIMIAGSVLADSDPDLYLEIVRLIARRREWRNARERARVAQIVAQRRRAGISS